MVKFFTMEHRGGLDEALETKKIISKDHFNNIVRFYEFYHCDNRINCIRFMHKDFPNNGDYPTWLCIELSINELFSSKDLELLRNYIDFLIEGEKENGK